MWKLSVREEDDVLYIHIRRKIIRKKIPERRKEEETEMIITSLHWTVYTAHIRCYSNNKNED